MSLKQITNWAGFLFRYCREPCRNSHYFSGRGRRSGIHLLGSHLA